ncbi:MULTISPECIES: three-helix bundle dimerization domain-containing protein [Streptomyces]|uniref:three-helix bundle dimerization domain-containing protein n=1 Tax=Streptomyces TaxID=1883 RepID=UPI0005751104|nr:MULTISPECIES: hypothetical protein [Streptomyces]ARP72792.1 hypothetical protein LK06_025720 [Streptomyces pluripotens]MCH0560451.1 hypothetical protein [Streptomyces sp. MUM 16J]
MIPRATGGDRCSGRRPSPHKDASRTTGNTRYPTSPPTPEAERRARQDVQERLLHRFPDLPSEALATAVAEAFAFFADARVRHCVPVLAYARASGQLSEPFTALGVSARGGKT